MNLTPFTPLDIEIATAIIDAINVDGYFTETLEEILQSISDEELTLQEVAAVLHRIQAFDPPGVGAQNPQECLLIQLRQLPERDPISDSGDPALSASIQAAGQSGPGANQTPPQDP